jgi:uncharacterized protein (DUF1697 family)
MYMHTYIILIRGINVGGKNKVPMAELKARLEELGFENVITYIQSGNVILQSKLDATTVAANIETMLIKKFKMDSPVIKTLVLTPKQLQAVVENRPKGFGDEPTKYHSDAIFLMGIDTGAAMAVFDPKEGVDMIWSGEAVVYSQRLSALRTKSRLSKIMGTKQYRSMTIRNWNTTTKLLQMVKELEKE